MHHPIAVHFIALFVWLAAGLSYSSSALANLDDWLLDVELDNSIGFHYGAGVDGLSIAGLSGALSLPFSYDFFFDYYKTSEDRARYDLNYFSAGINSNPFETWSVKFEYEYFGKSDVYEQKDYKLSIQYFPSNYLVAIGVSQGDAEAHIDSLVIDLIEEDLTGGSPLLDRIRNTRLSTDDKGYFAEAKLFLGNWQWGIDGKKVNYSEDIALLGARDRIQQLLDQQALAQIYGLIDWRLSADGTYAWETSSLQLGVSRIQSAVDRQTRDYLFATAEYFPRYWLSFSFTVADSLEEHLPYAEFATRIYW